MAHNRQQPSTWTNDDQIIWRHVALSQELIAYWTHWTELSTIYAAFVNVTKRAKVHRL